ncbi:hypothetical protein D3C73_1009810 [compost metagenome]
MPSFRLLQQASLREQHRRPTVREHILDPFRRIVRVQRHISAARFPYAEHPDQQLRRTSSQNADHLLRLHPARPQRIRQTIRFGVQLRIRQLAVFVDNRQRSRSALRLLLEQLVERSLSPRLIRFQACPLCSGLLRKSRR